MYFGIAYYPEHWPEERWPIDARMMQEAGLNGVRMGEFAWSAIEPVEGEYHFEWMDRAVALLAEHGVKTMMCTPSRTPPPWVLEKHPEILNTTADGRLANAGHRYTVCQNNPRFIELSRRIDRAVIEHYAHNDAVIAWHIDNEIGAGNACWCDTCRAAFLDYLRAKYETPQRLTECWGPHFWSFAFSDFQDVPLPARGGHPHPGLALEYARFQSKVNVDFAQWRYELMKRLSPAKWVTTNFQTSNASHTDIFDLGRATDVYGTNFYPPRVRNEFPLDYCRGARGALIILEQMTRLGQTIPAYGPGWMRLWAWRSIAHGARGIDFFRWRVCRWGQEMQRDGLLQHDGRPNRRYNELARMGKEIAQVGELIDSTRVEARIAIVMSYESRWALNAGMVGEPDMRVEAEAYRIHDALMERNVMVDAMDPREDLSKYSLIIAPRLYCVDGRIAANLRQCAAAGAIVCLTAPTGLVDEYNKAFDTPPPGRLLDLAGIEVEDYGRLPAPEPLREASGGLGKDFGEATGWAEEIRLTTARALAVFSRGWRRGAPAVTINDFGPGKVLHVGVTLERDSLRALVRLLCKLAKVPRLLKTPEGVRVCERRNDDARLLFLMNFNEQVETVQLDGEWEDAFSGKKRRTVPIPPLDLRLMCSRMV
ncbi:MAG: beta-galactosidase [Candidatus Sumerlaeota bacterium]|nr:beta-galactosidase [Candidatus Sumerlaeota bacterium]